MEAAATKEEQEAAKARRRDEAIALGRGHECGCCFDMEALVSAVTMFEESEKLTHPTGRHGRLHGGPLVLQTMRHILC